MPRQHISPNQINTNLKASWAVREAAKRFENKNYRSLSNEICNKIH